MAEGSFWFRRGCGDGTTVQRSGGFCGGGIYGLAFLGAAIYYLQHASTFGEGVLGILKAIVWPVLLVYKLLEFLNM